MRRILFIILSFCFVVNLRANDSVNIKPKRFMTGLDYGTGNITIGKRSEAYLNANPQPAFGMKNITSYNIYGGYLIGSKSGAIWKRISYVGLNFNASSFDFLEAITIIVNSGILALATLFKIQLLIKKPG